MGRTAVILVLGFGVILGIATRSISSRLAIAVDDAATYYDKTRAQNIASSAMEMYIWKLNHGAASAAHSYSDTVTGGAALTTITDIDRDGSSPDSVKVIVVGTYDSRWNQGATHGYTPVADTISVIAYSRPSANTTLSGALSISGGSTATLRSSGVDTLDGRDHTLAGNALASPPDSVYGMSYGAAPSITHSGVWYVVGEGGGPGVADTQHIAGQPSYDALALQLESLADTVIKVGGAGSAVFGDTSHPMIVEYYGGGSSSTKISGAGVFIMDLRGATNNMQFSNTLTWQGLVIVIGDPTGKYEAKWSNAKPITGALLMTGTTPKFETSNNLTVKYSGAAVNMALGLGNFSGYFVVADWWE